MAQFFSDNQIRRFIIQFAKVFSNWNVTRGKDPLGNDIVVRVPVQYGDSSRQAATILANNSASSLPSAPLITYYISGVEYDQKRTQVPTLIDSIHVRQRTFNQSTSQYEPTQGQAFTIDRLMPVPYTLRMTVDVWTSNVNQKLQLIEQLGVLFNPSLEIQSSDNFVDWASLSVIYQDGLTFSSRSIPQGTGNAIDVMSWKFYMPIWISPPAKLKKLGVVEKIIASIFQGNNLTDIQNDDLLLGTRQKITPYGYNLLFLGNTLQLLPASHHFKSDVRNLALPENQETDLYWEGLLDVYGALKPGISQMWLQNPYMETDIVGTILIDPSDGRLLIFNVDTDTLPQNTLAPIDGVVNPTKAGPGYGLPAVIPGRRYLIVDNIASDSDGWGPVTATTNDIIEYNGATGRWEVSFDSVANVLSTEIVTNLTTNIQYRYVNGVWQKSFEGYYEAGDFSIVI